MANSYPVLLMSDSLDVGGTERQLAEVAKALDRNLFEPHVAAFHAEGMRADELRRSGVPVIEIPVRSLKSWSAVAGARQLGRYIKTHKIALVHAFDYPTVIFATPAAKWYRTPVVLSSQRGERGYFPRQYQRALQLTDRMVNGIVVNSMFVRRELMNRYKVSGDLIHHCYNGIDSQLFHPGGRGSLTEGKIVIGCIAVLRPEKSLETLIEAFAILRPRWPATELMIVGDGPCGTKLREQADELGIAADCVFVPRTSEVAEWYRRIEIFVLPSTTEAFSNSLLEAMACGCCPVASDAGGNPEIITEGETGLLYPTRDAHALAAKLEMLLANPELRMRLATTARKRVKDDFTVRASATRMGEIYMEFLKWGSRSWRSAESRPRARMPAPHQN